MDGNILKAPLRGFLISLVLIQGDSGLLINLLDGSFNMQILFPLHLKPFNVIEDKNQQQIKWKSKTPIPSQIMMSRSRFIHIYHATYITWNNLTIM